MGVKGCHVFICLMVRKLTCILKISATDEIKVDIFGNLIKVVRGSTRSLDMKYVVRLFENNRETLEHNWRMSQEGGEFLNLKGI